MTAFVAIGYGEPRSGHVKVECQEKWKAPTIFPSGPGVFMLILFPIRNGKWGRMETKFIILCRKVQQAIKYRL